MSSESTEERTMSVTIPPELGDWLETQATTLDIDRETLLVQLLVTLQQTIEHNGDPEGTLPVTEAVDAHLEEAVSTTVEESLDELVREQVSRQLQEALDTAVRQQVSEATNTTQQRLESRISAVEDDYMAKLQDVRERVIQVKKETDTRAQQDHTHEEFDAVDDLATEVKMLQESFEQLETTYAEVVPEHEERLGEIEARLDTLEDRLKTVAWVVSDLREAHESGGGLQAVERIKRAGAKHDIERANCENCGESVVLALLTDPHCPHCNTTVTNVEPAGGWFGKPKLLIASQLESGE